MPRLTTHALNLRPAVGTWPADPRSNNNLLVRTVVFASVLLLAALTSAGADWQPVSLIVALAALMIAADALPVPARLIRLSPGLMIQVAAMALLGPAPAVTIGVISTLVESRVNRVPARLAFNNVFVFAALGLVGGLTFEFLRARLGLDRNDTAYAFLVMPVYCALAMFNLALVVVNHPRIELRDRLRIFRDTGLPSLPLELLSGVMAGAAVLVWGQAGLVAAAALLGLLVITIPLVRAVGDALRRATTCSRSGMSPMSAPRRSLASHPTVSAFSPSCSRSNSASAHVSPSRSMTVRCSAWSRSAGYGRARQSFLERRLGSAAPSNCRDPRDHLRLSSIDGL